MKNKKRYSFAGCDLLIESNTNRVIYRYSANSMQFEFDLFSHIGQPFVPYFEHIIKENNLKIELYDNPNDNYKCGYYERLVK